MIREPVVREDAPAKINLTLHVTGQRADGYHLLDSLVAFASVGDVVTATPGPLSLRLSGPQAAGLSAEADDNLVLRAARWLGAEARLELKKHLPVASGIGGGSADAAAAIRALCRLTGRALPDQAATAALGADVPVCLTGRARRMRGIGDQLSASIPLPAAQLVLVNPGVAVATPAVFRALTRKDGAPMPDPLPDFPDLAGLVGFLRAMRNDLEPPARAICPEVGTALAALAAQPGCLIARMSGSGATCFGLFAKEADMAAAAISAAHPDWWVRAAELRG